MSFEIGTATNLVDLATRLQNFLTAQGHAWGKRFVGVGTGDLVNYRGKAGTVAQTITITATSPTSFSVVGSVSGSLGTATVGTPFVSAQIDFTITAGGTAYVAGDVWTIGVSPPYQLMRSVNGALRQNLSNGLAGSYSQASQVFPASFQMRLINPAEVLQIGITAPADINHTPQAFVVEWSPDGVAWNAALTVTGQTAGTWFANTERRFAVPTTGAARLWWRLRVTTGNGTTLGWTRVDFYEAAGNGYSLNFEQPFFSVRHPGNDGALSGVFHSFGFFDNVGGDTYGANIVPHTSHQSTNHGYSQPGRDTIYTGLQLIDGAMPYWFVANGRRFMGAIKVSTVYASFYAGLMLPYARPSSYPLPWALGGSTNNPAARWSDTTAGSTFFARPHDAVGMLATRGPDNVWRYHASHNNYTNQASNLNRVYPHYATSASHDAWLIRECWGGNYPLFPIIPLTNGGGMYGELDGCFVAPGFGRASEDSVVLARQSHVWFQNVFRTTNRDYIAMRMD